METQKPLLKDEDSEEVDVHLYRSMIGSLMYLTSLRPDIMFAVYACARYQVNPKVLHFHVVKRIFRYLKGQPKLGLWYPKDSPFDLVTYTDSDYAGASLDRKSTIGGCQFFGCRLISWQCKKQTMVANSTTEAEYINIVKNYEKERMRRVVNIKTKERCVKTDRVLVSKRIERSVNAVRHILTTAGLLLLVQVNDVEDEAVNEEMDYSLERAATTATSLDAEQDRGNINKTQSKATLNEPSSIGTSSGVNTPRNLLSSRDYKFEKRVRRLEKKGELRTHKLKRLYKVGLSARVESSQESLGEEDASKQGRISDIDADARISLVGTHFDTDIDMFGVHDLVGDEVIVETEVVSKDVKLSVDEVTLAQALAALKSAKSKADKVMIQELEQGTITTTATITITAASTRPKAKGLVIHEQE
ncbi:hypothetical protein Tco_0847763 [Tanacetum coccineum]